MSTEDSGALLGQPLSDGLHKRSTGSMQPSRVNAKDAVRVQADTSPEGQGNVVVQEAFELQIDAKKLTVLQAAASQPGVLIPSSLAFYALLFGPALAWAIAVITGVAAFRGIPSNKRDVQHIMLWFDLGIFRTPAGPALPFIVLAVRALAMRLAKATTRPDRTQLNVTEVDTLLAEQPAGSDMTFKNVQVVMTDRKEVKKPPRGTLLQQVLPAYGVIAVVRVIVYMAHVAVQAAHNWQLHKQASKAAAAAGLDAPLKIPEVAYMSDHLLLGASVLACLHAELICSVSDAIKLSAWGVSGLLAEMLASAAILLSLLLSGLVCMDMHYTTRYYHERFESWAAAIAGAALFQVPLLLWLWSKRTVPKQLSV